MILFYNVFVTNNRQSAGSWNRIDRLDLFKYSLASYACIDRITDVIIYCELDGDYKTREMELRNYIDTLFLGRRIQFYPSSPVNQKQWQHALEHSILLLTDQPILYMGNDDHIFIDYNLDVLYEGLDLMACQPHNQINTIHISSWVEAVSTIYGLRCFQLNGRYWEADLLYADACQIVNSLFFRHVFFDLKMGDAFIRRSDSFLRNWYPLLGDYTFESDVPHPPVKTFLPLREIVRHFDGYIHVRVPLGCCPLLDIPTGFFDNNIVLNYCGEARNGEYGWGPYHPERKILEDLPLFWRGRLAAIHDHSTNCTPEGLIEMRNNAHRRMITAPHDRAYQRPTLCVPAVKENNYINYGNDTELPLEEKYIRIGYRLA